MTDRRRRPSRTLPTAPVHTETRRAPVWVLTIFFLGTILFAGFFLDAFLSENTERLQGMMIVPVLFGLTVPIALRIARTEGDATFFGIIMAGLVAKLAAAFIRYYVAVETYSGRADMVTYHEGGKLYVDSFRQLIFPSVNDLVGTTWIKVFTGFVYSITGSSLVAGGFAYAWIGFLGIVLLTRAFRIGIPSGNARRYTVAVLFLPSLLYWPASIGKESWMMFAIGLSSYGIACLYTRRSSGVIWFALGVGAIMMVRPHIALIEFVGIVLAFALRRPASRSMAGPALRIVGFAVVIGLGVFLVGQTASFFGQESLSVDSTLTDTISRTSDGGSQFTAVEVRTPLDMVPAFATVFFRPFVFEAGSSLEFLTAIECMAIVLLLVASWSRIKSVPRLVRNTPYLSYAIGYVLAFTFAFSSFANFGLLARQRVQALPFLLVLIALPRFQDLVGGREPTEPVLQVVPDPEPERPRYGPQHRTRRPARPGVTAPAIGGVRSGTPDQGK